MYFHQSVCDQVLSNLCFRFALDSLYEFFTKLHSYWLEKCIVVGNIVTNHNNCSVTSRPDLSIFTQFNLLKFCVGSFNTHTHKLELNVKLPNIGIQYIVSKTVIAENCAVLNRLVPNICSCNVHCTSKNSEDWLQSTPRMCQLWAFFL
jgi:hypothetical protein